MSMPPYDPSRPVYCPHCGAPIRPHDKFCLHCGKQLPMASRQQAADTVRQTAMRASNACESERATAAPPARRNARRLPLLLIALLLGIGVGYFLVRAPSSGATRAAASASPEAAPAPEMELQAPDDQKIDLSLVRLPEPPARDVLNPCSRADKDYFEQALSKDVAGEFLCEALSTQAQPDLFSVGMRPHRALNQLAAVVVIEYAGGKTVCTSQELVYFRKCVEKAELCAFSLDLADLTFTVGTEQGGTIPFATDGINIRKLIDRGHAYICFFEDGSLLAAATLADNSGAAD